MSGEDGDLYRFHTFTLNVAERQLLNDDTPVSMTPKAFDVLVFLVRRAGHLVEKDELLHSIWADSFVEEGNLTRIVHTLRRTLGDGKNGLGFIETVPKKGYRFVAGVTRVAGAGTEPEPPEKINHRPLSNSSSKLPLLIGAAVCAGLLLLGAFYVRQQATSASGEAIDSIAVLPFENLTQDPELDYLSDGITENVINTLSPLPNISVSPRSLVFGHKNSTDSPQKIGQDLNVRVVITGRLTQRDDSFVIQTEMIDVTRNAQIWGQQFSYPKHELLISQSYIAKEIVANLRLKLSDPEQQRIADSFTENPEAQKAYLNGLYLYNQSTQQSQNVEISFRVRKPLCEKSVENFLSAIKLQPNYALAYAGLARSYRCLAVDQFSEYHEKSREAALAAIRLDKSNALAHRLLALILWQQDWNWKSAEAEFRTAIELAPSDNADAREGLARLLSAEGRHDEAIQQIELIEKSSPVMLLDVAWVGYIYKDARQYDRAMEIFKNLKDVRPENTTARFGLAETYSFKGMHNEAVGEARRIVEITKGMSHAKMFLACMLARAGQNEEAVAILNDYKTKEPKPSAVLIASASTALGDKDGAFLWYGKALAERSLDLLQGVKVSPAYDELRDDPRFNDLLSGVGLD